MSEVIGKNIKRLAMNFPGLDLPTFSQRYQATFGSRLDQEIMSKLASERQVDLAYEDDKVVVRSRGNSSGKCSSQLKKVRQEPLPLQKLPNNTSRASHFPVVVTQVESPSKFWFNIYKPAHYDALNNLMDEMDKFYTGSDNGPYKVVRLCQVPPGTVAAARYLDRGYHRVLILRHVDNSSLELFYIDFGTTAVQKLRHVRFLLEEYSHLPAQAIEGRLWGVRKIGAKWGELVKVRLLELVDTTLGAMIAMIKSGDVENVISLQLLDIVPSDGLDVGNTLLEEGLVEKELVGDNQVGDNYPGDKDTKKQYQIISLLSKHEINLSKLLEMLTVDNELKDEKEMVIRALEEVREKKFSWREEILNI